MSPRKLVKMIPKDTYRNKIRELFPGMPSDEVEEVLNQVDEVIHKYGALRVMTIGIVVKKVVSDKASERG